jgi:hypothetical protein
MADVKFVHVPAQDGPGCNTQNTNVVFDINRVDSNDQFLARAVFPNDPRVNRSVLVDVTAFGANLQWPLKNILGHELGHVLGLRHEHVRAPGQPCPEDQDYRAITAYDAASIMHYPQCGGTSMTLAFSGTDMTGIAMVNGAPAQNATPMAQLTEPSNGATVAPTFTVRTSLVDTDLVKGELYIDGQLHQTVTTAPFQFEVTNASEGAHTLQIKATDGVGQIGEQTITVTVAKSGGPGGPGGGDPGGDDADPALVGGCMTGGSSGLALALALAGLRRRRRQR